MNCPVCEIDFENVLSHVETEHPEEMEKAEVLKSLVMISLFLSKNMDKILGEDWKEQLEKYRK